MRAVISAVLAGAIGMSCPLVAAEQPVAIVIHGGAGTILKKNFTPELEQAYQQNWRKPRNPDTRCL